MGENEQGGMLRTVVVVGIVAMVALVITLGVVGLKASMTKNTDRAVGTVVTTKVPYTVQNPDVTYEKYTPRNSSVYWGDHGDHGNLFPLVGDIPNNSWREDRLVLNSSERIYIRVNINNYVRPWTPTSSDDNDDQSKRLLEVYDENGNKISSKNTYYLYDKVYLDKDKDYTLVVKYFNNSGQTLHELSGDGHGDSALVSGTDDGSSYRLKIKSFEAATYDDKYVS